MKENYDVAIIGAGPAGVTAAIYIKRAELNCCIIEKEMIGGQINKTSSIENYPGILEISGPELANNFQKQLTNLNIKQIYSEVIEIIDKKDYKTIRLANNTEIKAKKIILAIGRSPKKLKKENSKSLEGKGISFCSLCDGYLYKNEDVSIVGAGNSALEESLYLSKICKSVTIINRQNSLRGDKILIDEVLKTKNINVIYNAEVENFEKKEDILSSITIKQNNTQKKLKTKACFIFIGYEPSTKFLKNLDILDEKGYIIVDEQKKTSIKGIYAAGDVVKKEAFQIVTATSDGSLAAVSCIKDMKEG